MPQPRTARLKVAESMEQAQQKFTRAQEEFRAAIEERIKILEDEKRTFELEFQKKIVAIREQAGSVLTGEMRDRIVALQLPAARSATSPQRVSEKKRAPYRTQETILKALSYDSGHTAREVAEIIGAENRNAVEVILGRLANRPPKKLRRRVRKSEKSQPYEYFLLKNST